MLMMPGALLGGREHGEQEAHRGEGRGAKGGGWREGEGIREGVRWTPAAVMPRAQRAVTMRRLKRTAMAAAGGEVGERGHGAGAFEVEPAGGALEG